MEIRNANYCFFHIKINHTGSVFLMDKDGRFVGTLSYGEDPDTMLSKPERLVADA